MEIKFAAQNHTLMHTRSLFCVCLARNFWAEI